jgi:phosphoglycolate phosphatase-like HAD superfamily hydrolase
VPYDAVYFDLDDTLTVTRRIKYEMHKAIARERYGRILSDADITVHYDKPLERSLRSLHAEPETPAAELFALLDVYQERFPHRLHDDALAVVGTALGRGVEVGVITGSPRRVALPLLARLGFPLDRMAGVHCYNTDRLRKPDPAVFDEARAEVARRRGRADPRLLYVGDGLDDYRAARAAGVDFIGVTTGDVTADDFRRAGARHTVARLSGVLPAVRPVS